MSILAAHWKNSLSSVKMFLLFFFCLEEKECEILDIGVGLAVHFHGRPSLEEFFRPSLKDDDDHDDDDDDKKD